MIKEEKSGRCKFLGEGEKEMADILFLNVLDLISDHYEYTNRRLMIIDILGEPSLIMNGSWK